MSLLDTPLNLNNTEKSGKYEASADPIKLAHNASDAINDGIMHGNLETANTTLDQLAADNQREVCVFYPSNNVFFQVSLIIVIPLMIIGFWVMVVAGKTAYLSKSFRTQAAMILLFSAGGFLWGIVRISKYVRDNQFLKRYKKYYQLIKFKRIVLMDELADYVHVTILRGQSGLNIFRRVILVMIILSLFCQMMSIGIICQIGLRTIII